MVLRSILRELRVLQTCCMVRVVDRKFGGAITSAVRRTHPKFWMRSQRQERELLVLISPIRYTYIAQSPSSPYTHTRYSRLEMLLLLAEVYTPLKTARSQPPDHDGSHWMSSSYIILDTI
jgi:hypothetical protein